MGNDPTITNGLQTSYLRNESPMESMSVCLLSELLNVISVLDKGTGGFARSGFDWPNNLPFGLRVMAENRVAPELVMNRLTAF